MDDSQKRRSYVLKIGNEPSITFFESYLSESAFVGLSTHEAYESHIMLEKFTLRNYSLQLRYYKKAIYASCTKTGTITRNYGIIDA